MPDPFLGITVQTSTMLPDGQIVMMNGTGGPKAFIIGVHPPDAPAVIARKIVREGLRDVLAWLDHPPPYLTGQEVLDRLAGRPAWSPR